MKFIITINVLLLITGCAAINVNHNTKPYIIKRAQDAIRSSVVEEYSRNEIWQLSTVNLGLVSSEYCQGSDRYTDLTKNNLIEQLKIKTQRLGGNGLVFDSCFLENNGRCNSLLSCKGIAYQVKDYL